MMNQTYLLSSEEIRIIAAASGLNDFMMFNAGSATTKEHQIQAVLRLINDGFFVNTENGLSPVKSLLPILKVFNCATIAIVGRISSGESPPVCIYCEKEHREFIRILPHQLRKGFYEMGVVDADALFDDLESQGFLPKMRESETPSKTKWNFYKENFPAEESGRYQAIFKRYDLSKKLVIDTALIERTSYTWTFTVWAKETARQAFYTHQVFMDWLRGMCFDD